MFYNVPHSGSAEGIRKSEESERETKPTEPVSPQKNMYHTLKHWINQQYYHNMQCSGK